MERKLATVLFVDLVDSTGLVVGSDPEVVRRRVTGEAVNTAARLQQVAMPGEILIGPTAYRLSAASLVLEDAGPLELKGLDSPARAWRLVDAVDGPRRPLGPRAPLVGRDAELE